MKLNIVTEPKGMRWVLRVWAEELAKRIPGCTISSMTVDRDADVNVFCNYALFQPCRHSISIFTHREKDARSFTFDSVAQQSHWCFGQSNYTLKLLPPEKSSILNIGMSEDFKFRDIRIGISGKNHPSGRKRREWAKRLGEEVSGIEIVWTDGDIARSDMPEWYDGVDYVLVTSEYEGGPMCVKEALSRGKMVITTRVGWYDDHSVLLFDTYEELRELVKKLVIKDDWEIGAKQLVDKATELCK